MQDFLLHTLYHRETKPCEFYNDLWLIGACRSEAVLPLSVHFLYRNYDHAEDSASHSCGNFFTVNGGFYPGVETKTVFNSSIPTFTGCRPAFLPLYADGIVNAAQGFPVAFFGPLWIFAAASMASWTAVLILPYPLTARLSTVFFLHSCLSVILTSNGLTPNQLQFLILHCIPEATPSPWRCSCTGSVCTHSHGKALFCEACRVMHHSQCKNSFFLAPLNSYRSKALYPTKYFSSRTYHWAQTCFHWRHSETTCCHWHCRKHSYSRVDAEADVIRTTLLALFSSEWQSQLYQFFRISRQMYCSGCHKGIKQVNIRPYPHSAEGMSHAECRQSPAPKEQMSSGIRNGLVRFSWLIYFSRNTCPRV